MNLQGVFVGDAARLGKMTNAEAGILSPPHPGGGAVLQGRLTLN